MATAIKKPIIRNKWNMERLKTVPKGESKVQQNLKDRTDINLIMKKYEKTGLLDFVKDPSKADYGDFSQVSDYQTALNQIMEAQEAFMTLPASTRKRFGNDPAQFVDFMQDPKNTEEAVKLGLAKAVEKPIVIDPIKDEKKETDKVEQKPV